MLLVAERKWRITERDGIAPDVSGPHTLTNCPDKQADGEQERGGPSEAGAVRCGGDTSGSVGAAGVDRPDRPRMDPTLPIELWLHMLLFIGRSNEGNTALLALK